MRISSNVVFQSGITRISELMSSQAKLQQQIATGRKTLSPSDDPVGASRALQIRHASSINDQYSLNRQTVARNLVAEESTLASVTNLLLSVKSDMVTAGNGGLSDSERSFLATEMRGALDQLIGLANTRDAAGNYIFSGYQSQAPAFAKTATGAVYQGDNQQRLLQVGATRYMEIANSGAEIFTVGGNDIFQTLHEFAELLNTPITDDAAAATFSAGLQVAQNSIDQGLETVLAARAMVGTRLNELEALEEFGQELSLQYAQALADVEELDYAKALSEISQQQIILEAAQKSFMKMSSMSLFNYF